MTFATPEREAWPFWDAATEVVRELGTPVYLYFPQQMRKSFSAMRDGLRAWGRSAIAYSLKTNPLADLLIDLRQLGSWIEVVSDWELALARQCGFANNKIVFNGPLKPPHVLERAAALALFTINIDSMEEISTLAPLARRTHKRIRLGVRVCPPRDSAHWSRFGVQLETGELEEAISVIKSESFLELACIHVHSGTQVERLGRYMEIIDFAQELWNRFSLDEDTWLDIGGGFPYQHDCLVDRQPLEPAELFTELRSAWRLSKCPPLLIEPGRSIAAPAMAIVSSVIACKPRLGEPTIIVVDSGTNHNVMAAFHDHPWFFRDTGPEDDFRICGPLCMEDDVLSSSIQGRRPQCGSLAVMLNAGAYSLSLLRTFIQPRPPVVQVQEDARWSVLVDR